MSETRALYKVRSSEHEQQTLVIDWAEINSIAHPELRLLHAIPNGAKLPWMRDKRGQRFSPQALKLKAEGLRSGVPDLCLPVPRKGYHGLYIELKHGDNKPSEDQVWWLDRLNELGYQALVCWEADEAIEAIGEYLSIGR